MIVRYSLSMSCAHDTELGLRKVKYTAYMSNSRVGKTRFWILIQSPSMVSAGAGRLLKLSWLQLLQLKRQRV